MPVPGSFADISETPSSNSPQGSETVGTIMNQYIQQGYAFIKMLYDGKMVPTVSVNMNSKQINNLANGVAPADAANVSQLGAYIPLAGSAGITGPLASSSTVAARSFILNGASSGLVWTDSQVSIYEDSSGNGPGDAVIRVGKTGGSVSYHVFYYNGGLSVTGDITATGNVTAYSDDRFKTNWKPMPKTFVKRFAAIKRGTFDRTDTNVKQIGVSAQSLRKVMARAVVKSRDSDTLSVAYGQAALVGAIEVADYAVQLEERVKLLERELRALKRKVK